MTCSNLSHLKKYATRNSPPFPANECRGSKKRGNDGTFYVSVVASNGVYRWQKVNKSPVKQSTSKRKSPVKCKCTTSKSSSVKDKSPVKRRSKAPIVDITGMDRVDVEKAYKKLCRWLERNTDFDCKEVNIDDNRHRMKGAYRDLVEFCKMV